MKKYSRKDVATCDSLIVLYDIAAVGSFFRMMRTLK